MFSTSKERIQAILLTTFLYKNTFPQKLKPDSPTQPFVPIFSLNLFQLGGLCTYQKMLFFIFNAVFKQFPSLPKLEKIYQELNPGLVFTSYSILNKLRS
jgi:hypothetical protein